MFINIADYFKNFPNTSNSAQQLLTTQSQKHFFRDFWEAKLWTISEKKSVLSSKSDSMLIILTKHVTESRLEQAAPEMILDDLILEKDSSPVQLIDISVRWILSATSIFAKVDSRPSDFMIS